MKKFIISEEERNNILSMHANLGYKTELNEQAVAQAPAQTTKPKEALNPYFQSDQIGTQISSKNPAFAKWVTDSQIQPYKSKFTLTQYDMGNIIQAVGTDGKTYYLNLRYFENPESFAGSINKSRELKKQLVSKVNELNNQQAPDGGPISKYQCFTNTGEINQSSSSNRNCSNVNKEYNKYKNEIGLTSAEQQAQFERFASVAPKFQPKTAG